jgi:hypothetical protein
LEEILPFVGCLGNLNENHRHLDFLWTLCERSMALLNSPDDFVAGHILSASETEILAA